MAPGPTTLGVNVSGGQMAGTLLAQMLQEGFYSQIVGRRIIQYEQLASTMDEMSALANGGAQDGTVVLAEEQTAGRGRFGRTWVSAKGNLYLSVLLRPTGKAAHYLSILASLAVVRAIRKTTGLECSLKWPNDILLGGRKVSGVLVEQAFQASELQHAVVGIGINVSFDPSTVAEVAMNATSLEIEAVKPVDRSELLRSLLQEMDTLYLALNQTKSQLDAEFNEQQASMFEEWRAGLSTLGQQVEVNWRGDIYAGNAENVDELGNLMLRLGDGRVVHLSAGEVTSAVQDQSGDA